jgi:Predicted outer membrane protein
MIAILFVLAFGACGTTAPSNDKMSRQQSGSVAKSQTAAQINAAEPSPEARLLGFLNLSNKGDLEGGRLAQERGESIAVKTYGRQMESDHMQMLEDSESAAKRMDVLPVMGTETQALIQDHAKAIPKLQAASGKEFDHLYLSHEIDMHKRVLQTAASLAGQIRNPALKEMMANARPLLEAHLKAAQSLMAEQR